VQLLQLVAGRNTRLVRFETAGTNTPVFQPVGFSQSKAKLDTLLNSAAGRTFAEGAIEHMSKKPLETVETAVNAATCRASGQSFCSTSGRVGELRANLAKKRY
jgi:hypothetical protein